ncbi:hypothetical protein LG322_08460 [Microbacterium aerolatum]|uniref:hypothetical protein n=1 Tax=Microbacterium aerolatum TaxID=153731 RepID=UPI00384C7FAF
MYFFIEVHSLAHRRESLDGTPQLSLPSTYKGSSMAGRSKISQHPAREKILEDIASGVTNAEVSRRYGLSESAVSRARIAHLDALTQEVDNGEPVPSEILGRLADLADSTRAARIRADATGSPQTRARAQANELAVLEKLAEKIGINDTSAIRLAQSTGTLVRVIQTYLRDHPEATADMYRLMGEHPELIELRDALKASQKRN